MCQKIALITIACAAVCVTLVKCEDDANVQGLAELFETASKYRPQARLFSTTSKCPSRETEYRVEKNSVFNWSVGRTFGHNALKRLSFIFLPVTFTLGVISTLLMALAVISVKNLAIGVLLLIVSVSQAVSRLFAATAVAPAPLVFHPRTEYLPAPLAAAPWPAPVPYSPYARSDNEPTITE